MQQPALGKKVLELRHAKGMTQEELAEECNLGLRTIQRVETAEVTPRSHTIKLIFSILDYDIYNSVGNINKMSWFKNLLKLIFDLFKLRTNTFAKLSILTVALLAFGVYSLTIFSNVKSPKKVRRIVEESNKNFIQWFNSGEVDRLVALYHEDACLVSRGCGKAFIKSYYETESLKYQFAELSIISLSISDTIAVEKGNWKIILGSGQEIGGEYMTEWRLAGNKWLMVSDLPGVSI